MQRTFAAATVVAIGVAATARWDEVSDAAQTIGPVRLAVGVALASVAVLAGGMSWHTYLRGLGATQPTRVSIAVFSMSQAAKYVPGSVWMSVAQAEASAAWQTPRRASLIGSGMSMATGVLSGAVVGVLSFGAAFEASRPAAVTLAIVVPAIAIVLHPRVFRWLVSHLPSRIDPPTRVALAGLSGRTTARALAWSFVSWLFFGVHLAVAADALTTISAGDAVTLTSAFALAWVGGFVFVVAPAGAGVRELILYAALGPILPTEFVLALVLFSRVVNILADLLLTGVGAVATRRLKRARVVGLEAETTPR